MYTSDTAKTYEGTKRLKAWPATRGEYNAYRGWTLPPGEHPDDAGYLVEYEDGGNPNHPNHDKYISWSPADVFERTYHEDTGFMLFGGALAALWRGEAVKRTGWNAPDMFVYLVPANAYPAQTGVAKAYFGEGALVPYRAYFAIKTAQGDVATWVPSTSDILADDWVSIWSPPEADEGPNPDAIPDDEVGEDDFTGEQVHDPKA